MEILAKFMLSPFHPRLLVYVLPFKRIVSDDEFYYNIGRHVVCFSEKRLNLLFAAFDEKRKARGRKNAKSAFSPKVERWCFRRGKKLWDSEIICIIRT